MGFKSDLRNDRAYINGIARFDVEVENNDSVFWSQNGQKLPENKQILKYEMVSAGSKRSLIIKNVTEKDFTNYSVKMGDVTNTANLEKKCPFTMQMESTEGYLEGIAVFECEVHQGVQVTWFKGTEKITKEKFSLLKYEEVCQGNTRRLIVKNITEKDFATFSCEAKGEKCSATLSKKSPWVLTLQNIEGQFDGIAVFEVLVKPGVQVSWFRKGFPIVKENFSVLKYEAVCDGNWRKLLVKNIQDEDFTEFSIKAKGEKCSAKLNKGSSKGVLRSQTYSAFSSDLKMAIDGKIGSIEVLQCNVNEKDEEIIWKKDDALISKENFSILKYETIADRYSRKLVIKNISPSDIGTYYCIATGSKSRTSTKFSVDGVGSEGPQAQLMNN